ncbi:MAG: formylglycine-generating enzyme family protein [Burkholderiaceae bacterium]
MNSSIQNRIISLISNQRFARSSFFAACFICSLAPVQASNENPGEIDWRKIRDAKLGVFSISATETSVGQFRRYVRATGKTTLAERNGGGLIYDNGWEQKIGWNWQSPFGQPAQDSEPAAHVTYDEAQAFCEWAGGQLPSDPQWLAAAYIESRAEPPPPFVPGTRYQYPTGSSPVGAHCLDGCGDPRGRAVTDGSVLNRGFGHARVASGAAGVNGLFDMGANLWEWVNEPMILGTTAAGAPRRTRGGSWWYGPAQMQAEHLASKPGDMAVAYIGFRCVRTIRR